MRIWLIKTGEPVPFIASEAGDRVYRAGTLAQAALQAGHDVTWWTAQFSHQHKSHRQVEANTLTSVPVSGVQKNLQLMFLKSPGYRGHVGFKRLWDHHILARNFKNLAPKVPKPDIILCAYPTIDLARSAVRFGRARNVPVVLDVRDFWPDVFYERLNQKLPIRTDGWMIPYERMAKQAFRGATAATGISQAAIDWARDRFGGDNTHDKPFYHSKHAANHTDNTDMEAFWSEKGVKLSAPKTRLVWAGNLVDDTDADTLLRALEALPEHLSKALEVVLCGNGSLVPRIEAMSKDLPHLVYAGWVNSDQLAALTNASHIGLLCYLDRFDFNASVPNKVVDYCAGSMRTLTNLNGEVPRLLGESDSVISYPTGDVEGLVNVLTQIAENPDRYRCKHPPAREVFETHFNAEHVLTHYVSWLEGLAKT